VNFIVEDKAITAKNKGVSADLLLKTQGTEGVIENDF